MHAYARTNAVVVHRGDKVQIKEGEVRDAGDTLVKAYPDLFTDTPAVRSSTPKQVTPSPEPPVEDATAEPGKKRRTRAD